MPAKWLGQYLHILRFSTSVLVVAVVVVVVGGVVVAVVSSKSAAAAAAASFWLHYQTQSSESKYSNNSKDIQNTNYIQAFYPTVCYINTFKSHYNSEIDDPHIPFHSPWQ